MGVYSGYSLNESTSFNRPMDGHVMDSVIEAVVNDRNMFNAVISVDFIDAYNEADEPEGAASDSSETKKAAKGSIIKKIKELFNKAIETIKRFVSTFVGKIQNLIHNDAKLVKQYSADFEKNKGTAEIENYRPLVEDPFESAMIGIDNSRNAYDKCADQIDAATTSDAIGEIVKSFSKEDSKKETKEMKDFYNSDEAFFGKKVDKFSDFGGKQGTIILDAVKNGSKWINKVKSFGNRMVAELKDAQKQLKLDKPEAKLKEDQGLSLAAINGKYKIANVLCKLINKEVNAYCNGMARYIAAARRSFVTIAKGKATTATDEAVVYAIGAASDIYVEQTLAM